MEELARPIQSSVDAYSYPDNVSWSDSRSALGELETPWCRLFGGTLLDQSSSSGKPSSPNDVAAAGGKVQAPGADGPGRVKADKGRSRGRGKGKKASGRGVVSPPAKWTSLLAPALGASGGVAVGLMESGGARGRCRVRLPDVLGSFLKFSTTALVLGAGSLLVTGHSSGSRTRPLLPCISWRLAVLVVLSHVKK